MPPMIFALTLLLGCQLVGEAVVRALGVPFPGPVVGMFLLLAILVWRGRREVDGRPPADEVPPALSQATNVLLGNLSLLFVPAAVGIVRHAALVRDHAGAILAAIAVSTLAALAVTALVFQALMKRRARA
jgi:holin-like protein